MSKKFNFINYEDYDFYHARLGRGAVVVAVKKNSKNGVGEGKGTTDLDVARYFCSREQKLEGKPQQLDPIQSIREKNGMVEIEVEFNRRRGDYPRADPMRAVVRRILPRSQVTLEIVEKNESA